MAPKGQSTRPTADRTREALFNVLEHAAWSPGLSGLRVADLFAGTGALGLEALSRGADFCAFVETDAAARDGLARNIGDLGCDDRGRVWMADAARLPPRTAEQGATFDLVFLDPPYGKGLAERSLVCLARGDWLSGASLLVVERGAGDGALEHPGYRSLDERVWGAAKVSFLTPG